MEWNCPCNKQTPLHGTKYMLSRRKIVCFITRTIPFHITYNKQCSLVFWTFPLLICKVHWPNNLGSFKSCPLLRDWWFTNCVFKDPRCKYTNLPVRWNFYKGKIREKTLQCIGSIHIRCTYKKFSKTNVKYDWTI